MIESKVELYDPSFEEEKYPCYGIRILHKTNEVDVCRDKKTIKRFSQDCFPDINFNDVNSISKLIKTVKEEGCVGLMRAYKIQQ